MQRARGIAPVQSSAEIEESIATQMGEQMTTEYDMLNAMVNKPTLPDYKTKDADSNAVEGGAPHLS